MLAIAEQLDLCGFESLEFFGFAGYIKYVKEHKENPWVWMKLGAKKLHRTRLRYHGGLASGFEKVPRSVRLLMIERVIWAAVDFQCRAQRGSAQLSAMGRLNSDQSGGKSFQVHGQARRQSGRCAAPIRSFSISAPGTRRHDIQFALAAAHDGDGKQNAGDIGGVRPRARRVRLSNRPHTEAPQVMDANVKDKILNRQRAKEWQNWAPPDLSLQEVEINLAATACQAKSWYCA